LAEISQVLLIDRYACYVGSIGPDIVTVETDATGVLRDYSALFECVEDSLDAVISHGEQKAAENK